MRKLPRRRERNRGGFRGAKPTSPRPATRAGRRSRPCPPPSWAGPARRLPASGRTSPPRPAGPAPRDRGSSRRPAHARPDRAGRRERRAGGGCGTQGTMLSPVPPLRDGGRGGRRRAVPITSPHAFYGRRMGRRTARGREKPDDEATGPDGRAGRVRVGAIACSGGPGEPDRPGALNAGVPAEAASIIGEVKQVEGTTAGGAAGGQQVATAAPAIPSRGSACGASSRILVRSGGRTSRGSAADLRWARGCRRGSRWAAGASLTPCRPTPAPSWSSAEGRCRAEITEGAGNGGGSPAVRFRPLPDVAADSERG